MSGRVANKVGIDVTRSPSSHHHLENLSYVHKVRLPPKQKLLEEFTSTLDALDMSAQLRTSHRYQFRTSVGCLIEKVLGLGVNLRSTDTFTGLTY
ncbi:hypothetical protein RHGRI_023669 [Rhododendron griersonianum]|uniref:Uncharacterized protein n=1 Tax=Rhododendron griersonianum TaxID=479676 RepID=A0AAV6J6F5_9ERIC|nr:hypothetical protein RHGRI_023669 [Rhododendron griersonianum]